MQQVLSQRSEGAICRQRSSLREETALLATSSSASLCHERGEETKSIDKSASRLRIVTTLKGVILGTARTGGPFQEPSDTMLSRAAKIIQGKRDVPMKVKGRRR
jgi:hypothetical protein